MQLIEGTVTAMHGPLVRVQVGDQTMVVSSRRRLNWEGGSPPAARLVVGDRVSLEMKGDEGVVVAVSCRTNSVVRKSPGADRPQVIAANIDQALVVFAAQVPEPKRGLLDRFLVAGQLSGVHVLITINKIDQGLELVEPWLEVYEELGYEVLRVSARTGWGLGRIRRLLQERTTLFCGPSGGGKSSLLNAVYPGFRLKVGSISEATGKGTHTTTTAELMPLPYGGFVVDTPGLREFGLWGASPENLVAAFPEMASLADGCRFADCSHIHEPDCAVLEAVNDGTVDAFRHSSYAKILSEAME